MLYILARFLPGPAKFRDNGLKTDTEASAPRKECSTENTKTMTQACLGSGLASDPCSAGFMRCSPRFEHPALVRFCLTLRITLD